MPHQDDEYGQSAEAERREREVSPPTPPMFVEPPDERLDHIAKLPVNWDSYGAPAILPETIDRARRLAKLFALPPIICPGGSGSVQLEWHTQAFDIEITVPPELTPLEWYADEMGIGESWSDEHRPVTEHAPPAAPSTAPRDLTPGEERSLERTAVLVAEVGRLRNAMRDCLDNLPEGFAARDILQRALGEREVKE